jgi:hypothetical protein
MNCKVILNKFELIKNFGIKWIFGTYMNFQQKNIYKLQLNLFKSTQEASDIKKKENLIMEKRSKLLMIRKKNK